MGNISAHGRSPAPRRPTHELVGEHLEQIGIASEVSDLHSRDVVHPLAVDRPRLIATDMRGDVIGPQLASTGRDAAELREATIEAQLAQRILRAPAHADHPARTHLTRQRASARGMVRTCCSRCPTRLSATSASVRSRSRRQCVTTVATDVTARGHGCSITTDVRSCSAATVITSHRPEPSSAARILACSCRPSVASASTLSATRARRSP